MRGKFRSWLEMRRKSIIQKCYFITESPGLKNLGLSSFQNELKQSWYSYAMLVHLDLYSDLHQKEGRRLLEIIQAVLFYVLHCLYCYLHSSCTSVAAYKITFIIRYFNCVPKLMKKREWFVFEEKSESLNKSCVSVNHLGENEWRKFSKENTSQYYNSLYGMILNWRLCMRPRKMQNWLIETKWESYWPKKAFERLAIFWQCFLNC